MQTVAVVGAGAMGLVVVERFLAAGLRVVVYDPSAAAQARAQMAGAAVAESAAAAAAGADSVSVMVLDDAQVRAAVLGSDGALSGMGRGGVLLLHSTINPATTRDVAAAAQARGVAVADACITGIPAIFRAGQALCLAGGDAALIERLTPHLQHLVARVLYMGPLGAGNVSKVVHNLVSLTYQVALHEGLQMLAAAGVPAESTREMVAHITARRALGEDPYRLAARPQGNLFDAILPLARDIAADLAVPAPLTAYLADAEPKLY